MQLAGYSVTVDYFVLVDYSAMVDYFVDYSAMAGMEKAGSLEVRLGERLHYALVTEVVEQYWDYFDSYRKMRD